MKITESLSIPDDEFSFTASRSSGPGGQNVNKVSTRITVRIDITNSPSLTADEKALVTERLRTRITAGGILSVSSQRYRTQGENRRAAADRLAELIGAALERKPVRHKTRTPRSAHRERLDEKKRRSAVKRSRAKVSDDRET